MLASAKRYAAFFTSFEAARAAEVRDSLRRSVPERLAIGALAVAAHGHARYTKDLDVWVGSA